jgi:hypothetical protein
MSELNVTPVTKEAVPAVHGGPPSQKRFPAPIPLARPRPSGDLLGWGIAGSVLGIFIASIGLAVNASATTDQYGDTSYGGTAFIVIGGIVLIGSLIGLAVGVARFAGSVFLLSAERYDVSLAAEIKAAKAAAAVETATPTD